jgi:dUTP pyrophosphatase
MEKITVKIKRIENNFNDIPLPGYATEGSAGMDIRAAVEDSLVLKANGFCAVPTNLSVEIPEGFEIQVRARSGLAFKHGIGVLNAPGTIDSDYRGEIKIILFNFSNEDFVINRGERIAQLVLSKVYIASPVSANTLNGSQRGDGGFGSTGKA